MTDEVEKDRVFRAQFGIKLTPTASTGKRRHYESLHALATDLLEAHLDIEAEKSQGRDPKVRWWRLHRDYRKNQHPEPKQNYPHYSEIFWVEEFIDGQWVPLEYSVTEPQVHIGGVSV